MAALRIGILDGDDIGHEIVPAAVEIGCLHDNVDLVIVRENNEGFRPDRNMVVPRNLER